MAVQICRDLNVDVIKRGSSRVVYAKQNDVNSRFLNVRIQEDGTDMSVKSTWSVMFNVTRSDNLSDVFKGTVNEDGTVKVPLTAWMLELEGTLVCDISLVSDDPEVAKLTTMSFNIYVEGAAVSDATITEKEEYSVIVDLLTRTADTEAKTRALYDDIAGKYANGEFDGKSAFDYAKEKGYTGTEEEFAEEMALYGHISQVVNTHLSNKSNPHNVTAYQIGAAPTGFGLGDSGKHCADCNEAIQSGFYALSGETCVNVPADMRYSPMIVSRRFGTIIQFVDNGISSIRRVITNYGSTDPNKPLTYGEWEWINPPMKFGVPYRTIKRFLNKPVYTIAQSLGSLPNNGAKEVALGVLNISNVVSTQPTIYLPSRMVPGSNSYNCGCSIVNKDFEPLFNVELYRGSDNIEYVGVHTHMDLSDRQGHIVVEYTVD